MLDERQITLTKSLMAHFEAMGMSRRNFLKLLAAAGGGASLSALIAACGGDDDDDDDDDDGDSGGADPTATTADSGDEPTATSDSGGGGGGDSDEPRVLIIASGQDVSNLDPHTGHDYSIASTQKSVYDTLLRYYGNPAELVNVLAADYEANDDASVWTVTLDDRAVFHDGSPVTASDVAYSAGRLLRKNLGAAWMFVAVMDEDSAEVVDDQTVVFNLNSPFSPFPLILPWLFVANEEVVKANETDGDEGEGWLLDHEAGSGPFTIKSWNVGDSYEFEAVPDYWHGWPDQGQPLDGYIWKIMRESSSQRLALLAGEIDMAHGLSSDDWVAVSGEPGMMSINEPGLGAFAIKLNNQKGPTADINVRKAIAYAMDYDAVIDALNGRASLMEGPLPNLGEFNNPDLNIYRLDLDKAKEHLDMSDHADGFELEYVYVTGLQIEEQIGLILLDNLSQIGIDIKLQALVWPDMVARALEVDTAPDMMAVYSGTSYSDPDNFLWQAYHSTQAGFWAAASHYINPDLDKILEDARSTPSHEERVRLYHEAQQILVDDAAEVWIQSQWSSWVWRDDVFYQYTPIMGQYVAPMYFLT